MDASLVPGGKARLSPRRLVKVFLHGEPFGRKINLSVHNSYDSLSFTLKRLGNNYSHNADYLEDGDGYNGDVNAATADGDEDAAGEDEADAAAVTEDGDGDGACDDEDVAAGEDEDDDVAEDGNASSEE
ncbi:hypothetical protein ACQ4PT_060496 [Festuca glaucescens]